MNFVKSMFKRITMISVIFLIAMICIMGWRGWVIVPVNTELAGEFMGKVEKKPVKSGFNLINPLAVYKPYSLKEKAIILDDFSLLARDKFVTKADIAVYGRFAKGYSCKTLEKWGEAGLFMETVVIPKIKAMILEASKATAELSEMYFDAVTLVDLEKLVIKRYNAENPGYQISTVKFSDIRLDPAIVTAVRETKKRQQKEEIQQADFRIKQIKAQEIVAVADAERDADISRSIGKKALYDVEYYRNLKLVKTLSPELIEYTRALAMRDFASKIEPGVLPNSVLPAGSPMMFGIDTKVNKTNMGKEESKKLRKLKKEADDNIKKLDEEFVKKAEEKAAKSIKDPDENKLL
jgi:hypothetical protein